MYPHRSVVGVQSSSENLMKPNIFTRPLNVYFPRPPPLPLCVTPFQERLKANCKPTVHEMMFFMNAWALAYLTVAAYLSGQGTEGLRFCLENPAVMVRYMTHLDHCCRKLVIILSREFTMRMLPGDGLLEVPIFCIWR